MASMSVLKGLFVSSTVCSLVSLVLQGSKVISCCFCMQRGDSKLLNTASLHETGRCIGLGVGLVVGPVHAAAVCRVAAYYNSISCPCPPPCPRTNPP
jgi:hypothetical protein